MEQFDLLYSEAEVMRLLGLTKGELSKLRKRGLPFVKFSSKCRAYFKNDVLSFGVQNRIMLKPEKIGLN
ncbi:MAG: hypothetical protein ABSH06_14350 [Thermodesulfobacteriota bacterium]|jgi:hypothetical protein